jgi:AcrR family transcriptional regulator
MKTRKLTSRDLAQQRTRETLLTTAARLVAEEGFGGVSIGDITAAAGFTKGAFYSNFESREAMVLELLRHLHLQQRDSMRAIAAQGPPANLARALDQLAEIAVRHADSPTASLLIGEMQLQARRDAQVASRVRAGFEEQLNRLVAWLDEVLESAARRPALSSRELARTIMALSQGFAQQPADRTALKAILRRVLGALFGEE